MLFPRLTLEPVDRTLRIQHVDFYNENVTSKHCADNIFMLTRDPGSTHSSIGLLAALYGAALRGVTRCDLPCSERDLRELSFIKFVYPYKEDGVLKVRLFLVGEG